MKRILYGIHILALWAFKIGTWGLFCFVMSPIIYFFWKRNREEVTRDLANEVFRSALRAQAERIEAWKESIWSFRNDFEGIIKRTGKGRVKFERGELIMPPEGELLDPHEGGWIFWVSSEMREEVIRTATEMFRHRVRHYTRGTLSTLIPSK